MREHVEQPVTIEYRIRLAGVERGLLGRRNILAEGTIHLPLPIPVDTTPAALTADGEVLMDRAPCPPAVDREVRARVAAMAAGFTAPLNPGEEAA